MPHHHSTWKTRQGTAKRDTFPWINSQIITVSESWPRELIFCFFFVRLSRWIFFSFFWGSLKEGIDVYIIWVFPKIGVPQIIHLIGFSWVFHYKPSIWGTPILETPIYTGWWQLKYFWNLHPENGVSWSNLTDIFSNGLKPPTSTCIFLDGNWWFPYIPWWIGVWVYLVGVRIPNHRDTMRSLQCRNACWLSSESSMMFEIRPFLYPAR